jgi:hypothetical protein
MRFALMGILALGVVGGYGSAIARAAHCGGGCSSRAGWHDGRLSDSRWGHRFEQPRDEVKQTAAAPQTVVVQQPVPAAPAPQIFVIMPGTQPSAAQPQTIVVPTVAVPAAAATPTQPQ